MSGFIDPDRLTVLQELLADVDSFGAEDQQCLRTESELPTLVRRAVQEGLASARYHQIDVYEFKGLHFVVGLRKKPSGLGDIAYDLMGGLTQDDLDPLLAERLRWMAARSAPSYRRAFLGYWPRFAPAIVFLLMGLWVVLSRGPHTLAMIFIAIGLGMGGFMAVYTWTLLDRLTDRMNRIRRMAQAS